MFVKVIVDNHYGRGLRRHVINFEIHQWMEIKLS